MKKTLQLTILLLVTFPLYTFAQVGTQIDYVDNVGSATLAYNGIINGKHSYLQSGGDQILISYSSGRWEITCCGNGTTIAHSDEPTATNPPNSTVGNYQIDDGETESLSISGTGSTATLPVELKSFKIHTIDNSFQLLWQTASETNNAGFEIQRSTNGKTFKTLAFVEGNGTSLKEQEYHYDDENLHNGQRYYYRLKQLDFDGAFAYSDILTAKIKSIGIASLLSPNPTLTGHTQLDYTTESVGQLQLRVFDVAGKELMAQNYTVNTGHNRFGLDLSELGKGLYFVKLEQGNSSSYEKVLVE